MDENGYPTEEELLNIECWGISDLPGLFDYMEQFFDQYGSFTRKDNLIRISTGGWSGCEDVLSAFHDNGSGCLWMVTWVMNMRGGLYIFQSPRDKNLMTIKEYQESRGEINDVILASLNKQFIADVAEQFDISGEEGFGFYRNDAKELEDCISKTPYIPQLIDDQPICETEEENE